MKITEAQLRRIIRENLLLEGTDEEAWELVGQKDPNIRSVVKAAGLAYDYESVNKLVPIIDSVAPVALSPAEIVNLKNFSNRPGQEHLVDAMRRARRASDPREEYARHMASRDRGESRSRGYDPAENYDRIVRGDYEPPVLIQIDGELYVIGGRTRLYAALAADTDIQVKILDPDHLGQISSRRKGKKALTNRALSHK